MEVTIYLLGIPEGDVLLDDEPVTDVKLVWDGTMSGVPRVGDRVPVGPTLSKVVQVTWELDTGRPRVELRPIDFRERSGDRHDPLKFVRKAESQGWHPEAVPEPVAGLLRKMWDSEASEDS